MGTYELVVAVGNTRVPLQNPAQRVTVVPGPVASFVRFPFRPFIAARPNLWIVRGTDRFGNDVEDAGSSLYSSVLSHNALTDPQYVAQGAVAYAGNGNYSLRYLPAYAGTYSASLKLSLPGAAAIESSYTVTVLAATCAGDDPARPYRCPDDACVANYSLCAGVTTCPANAPVRCSVDASGSAVCSASLAQCPCGSGLTRCPNTGACAASCLDATLCPADFPVACLRCAAFALVGEQWGCN